MENFDKIIDIDSVFMYNLSNLLSRYLAKVRRD